MIVSLLCVLCIVLVVEIVIKISLEVFGITEVESKLIFMTMVYFFMFCGVLIWTI